jgi:hypothetical protein
MLCRGLPLQELHIASCKKVQIASDARLSLDQVNFIAG